MIQLSKIYSNSFWFLVYDTQPNGNEIEFITNKFFKSSEKAMSWFDKKRKAKHFINPRAIEFKGIDKLNFFFP